MKTIITEGNNSVTINYDDALSGERITRKFFSGGMYVKESDSAKRYPQVCERLSSTGSTLMATSETLAAVIRREYNAMRRAEKHGDAQRGRP